MADTDVSAAGPRAAGSGSGTGRTSRRARSGGTALRGDRRPARGHAARARDHLGRLPDHPPGDTFLTPRNLWNLSVQTSVVAIMATGHGPDHRRRGTSTCRWGPRWPRVGMVMAVAADTTGCPKWIGFDHPATWVIALVAGLVLGAAIGAFQGAIVAYIGVPSFIVTLGGFLVWRGVAWWLASGQTIAPDGLELPAARRRRRGDDRRHLELGRRRRSRASASSPLQIIKRRQRARYGFRLRPMWARDHAHGAAACVAVLAAIWFLNRYYLPAGLVEQRGERTRVATSRSAWRIPVLIAIGVGDRDDVHRDPPTVRTLRLRDRRQPGGGRARRDQDEADDREDVRADGCSWSASPARCRSPGSTRR